MPFPKKTSLLPQHTVESYKELARLRRAASELRLGALSDGATAKFEDRKAPPADANVTILKDGGKVTVLLGKTRPITKLSTKAALGHSDLSIPELKTEKDSIRNLAKRKRAIRQAGIPED